VDKYRPILVPTWGVFVDAPVDVLLSGANSRGFLLVRVFKPCVKALLYLHPE